MKRTIRTFITKQRAVATLTLVISFCTLLATAAPALELNSKSLAYIGIVSGLATVLLRLATNQAVDEALMTPVPRPSHHERSGDTPPPPVPAPPTEGETLPGYRVGDVHE